MHYLESLLIDSVSNVMFGGNRTCMIGFEFFNKTNKKNKIKNPMHLWQMIQLAGSSCKQVENIYTNGFKSFSFFFLVLFLFVIYFFNYVIRSFLRKARQHHIGIFHIYKIKG